MFLSTVYDKILLVHPKTPRLCTCQPQSLYLLPFLCGAFLGTLVVHNLGGCLFILGACRGGWGGCGLFWVFLVWAGSYFRGLGVHLWWGCEMRREVSGTYVRFEVHLPCFLQSFVLLFAAFYILYRACTRSEFCQKRVLHCAVVIWATAKVHNHLIPVTHTVQGCKNAKNNQEKDSMQERQ